MSNTNTPVVSFDPEKLLSLRQIAVEAHAAAKEAWNKANEVQRLASEAADDLSAYAFHGEVGLTEQKVQREKARAYQDAMGQEVMNGSPRMLGAGAVQARY